MKAKPLTIATLAAALGLALSTVVVEAGSNLNSSKSNTYKVANADDEAACKAAGGKVETKDGQKVCSVPFVGGALAN